MTEKTGNYWSDISKPLQLALRKFQFDDALYVIVPYDDYSLIIRSLRIAGYNQLADSMQERLSYTQGAEQVIVSKDQLEGILASMPFASTEQVSAT